VRILLDTHVFLWLQTDPERLGEHLRLVEDEHNTLLVSAASSWEIAIKYGLGRLALPEPPDHYVPERLRLIGAEALAIEHSHTLAVASLPPLHRDPFDRLLVAQAGLVDAPILTADPTVAQYAVPTIMLS
jgi:PIN domain nuclease of toxin-antitoxin system